MRRGKKKKKSQQLHQVMAHKQGIISQKRLSTQEHAYQAHTRTHTHAFSLNSHTKHMAHHGVATERVVNEWSGWRGGGGDEAR